MQLIYEREPADEMPETDLVQHMLIIADDNRATFRFDGIWQHLDYAKGDIVIIPATHTLSKTLIDREVPLMELFVEPATLMRAAFESTNSASVELVPQLHLRDPLIQHIWLELKAALETGGADSKFICRIDGNSFGSSFAATVLSTQAKN